jgi:hypothetical protein
MMLAANHAIAGGAQLVGVAMQPQFPNHSDSTVPDEYLSIPPLDEFPATALPETMSLQQAQSTLQSNLPARAAAASVSVFDWVGNERRAQITLTLPANVTTTQGQNLGAWANDQVRSLNAQGAGIGSIVVSVTNSLDGTPLATIASDPTWHERFVWLAPIVKPYGFRGEDAAPQDQAQAEANAANAYAGVAVGAVTGSPPGLPPLPPSP